jgi:uncharacterized protein
MAVSPVVLPQVDEVAPIRHIAAIPQEVPVLIMSGARDELARPEEVRDLYEQLATHARLVMFDEAAHESLLRADAARYEAAVVPFVRAAVAH